MTRKARQAIEREAKRHGARVIDLVQGQKHELVYIRTASGKDFEMAFARAPRDDVEMRRLVRRKIEAEA